MANVLVDFPVGIYGPSAVVDVPIEATTVIEADLALAYEELFSACYIRLQAQDPLDASIRSGVQAVLAAKAS
jgi:hypothetical protein